MKRIYKTQSLFVLFAILCMFSFFVSIARVGYAQISGVSFDPIDISMSPTNPGPLQNTTITIKSFSTDLNRATISWTEDGSIISQGTGVTSVTVKSPDLGESSVVRVVVTTSDGKTYTKQMVLKPGDVDLIWETDGYVHPFYRGKAPFSYQNGIKITAVPHLVGQDGVKLDPTKLVYQWRQDSFALANQSGYGKQSVLIKGAVVPRPFTVTVNVSSVDGSITASGAMSLDMIAPTISFYEEDPLYGPMYNVSVTNNYRVKNEETKIIAVPFGFNTQGRDLSYVWSINGMERDELLNDRVVTLRVKEGTEGSSDVGLNIRNTVEILQGARSGFTARVSRLNESLPENIF